MERLKKKELQLLRLQKEQREEQQKLALKHLITSEESIPIMINYAEDYLRNSKIDSLSQYSPIQISRLIFDKELEEIRLEFQKLPNKQMRIEHFILILIKIMKFPFQKTPLYMVGLKDMFYQIVEEGKQNITYNEFFKYILGEFVTMKQQQQNTEFQVQILQRKKQDYLLHDNGIKRIYYSKDMKMILSLDQRSNSIKVYDQEMKNIGKFCPKKQKHNNRFPTILDFDYSEITERLGLVLSDQTLSTVHLGNFIEKTPLQFESMASNQLVYPLPEKMAHIFFIQMMNKWFTVSDQGNKVFLFDMERIRTQPEKVMTKLKLDFNEQPFSSILQIVSLSCVCVIAGNQVNFYNQNFTELRFKKFTHHEQIKHFKYSDEKNQFYLCGIQKNITIFSLNRSGSPSSIRVFPTNKIVQDFQLFPYFDTIVIADENNDVRLIHESTRMTYQQINYNHIVKAKDKTISIYKISKNQFAIYQTYLLVMSQEKIAIQRDIQYSFSPYYYFDQEKEELYLSVNNQLLSFSIFSGEIRKNYSFDSSNIEKHYAFFRGPRCPIFILDKDFNIYEVYQKDELLQGEHKSYRKKINIEEVQNCFYDSSLSTMIIVNKNSINQVRNDKNNNFNLLNTINLEGFFPIVMSTFCQNTKIITFLTSDQLIYQFKNHNFHIDHCYRFAFPKDYVQLEDKIIVKFHYDSHYDIFVILNNKNEIYFVDRVSRQQLYFNLTEHMPAKLKKLQFKFFSYQLITEKQSLLQPYILINDDTGFLVQFSLKSILDQFKFTIKMQESGLKSMFKETQIMNRQNVQVQQIKLTQQNKLRRTYQQIGLMKAHQKAISVAIKLKVQILVTLTISIDGYIRLWNSKYKLLFSLKIPSLLRVSWDMKEIEQIKKKKSIDQLLSVFKNHYYPTFQQRNSPVQVFNKSKKFKKGPQQIPKINLNDPIKLEIENKDIQQIVMQKQDYSTFYGTKDKSRTQAFFHTTGKIYAHPWRKNRDFVNIFSKAPSPNKYKSKIPNHLIQLRTSLDMIQKVKEAVNYKEAERLLPQLSFYQPENYQSQRKKDETLNNQQESENFQSCLYVKKQKKKKKINQFDEIDKQFKKKQMSLTARKWVPKKRRERNTSVIQMKSQVTALHSQGKIDPIKAIQRIFEQHNRQCMQSKKGRMIRIPKISVSKEMF